MRVLNTIMCGLFHEFSRENAYIIYSNQITTVLKCGKLLI